MKKLILMLSIGLMSTFANATAVTELTNKLDGMDITYTFSGGNAYNVKFEKDQLSYRFVSGSKPDRWWGPYPYKAMKTDKGEYFVAWTEDGYYATILFDKDGKSLYGSSIAGKRTYFQKAEINSLKK